MPYASARPGIPDEALCEILGRFWQIKLRSIDLLETWRDSARDSDLRAGAGAQLTDERRHLRLLADELKRRSGRQPSAVDHVVAKAFAVVQAQASEALRVCAYYRGIKADSQERLYKLIGYADTRLIELLEQILRDDERALRWADLRLRSLSGEDVRRCNALLGKMEGTMAAVWSRPWRHLSASRLAYLANG